MNRKPQNILIIQNAIPHYRIAFFNLLSETCDLTILHSGPEIIGSAVEFKQIVLRKWSFGSIYRFSGVGRQIRNFDVVVAMFDLHCLASIEATLICKIKKIPIVLWGHGMGTSALLIPARVAWTKIADALLLYDYNRMGAFLKHGVSRDMIFECPNTVDISNSSKSPNTIKTSFLFVGRLYSEKKIDQLIRCFSMIDEKIVSNITLDIVGEGEELENLKVQAISYSKNTNINFHGKITDDDVLKALFHNSIAYVGPGDMGLSILHSFAYGVPVITASHRHHGPEAHNLDDTNSWIIDGSDEALISLFEKLISNPTEALVKGTNAYELYNNSRRIEHMVDGFYDAVRYVSF